MEGLYLSSTYLFDTHALLFWATRQSVTEEFISFFETQNENGNLFISSVSFWEIGLLSQAGRISLKNIPRWKEELVKNSNIKIIDPTADEMIESTQLPKHHKDPFDRLLIAQAKSHSATLVTRDKMIQEYSVKVFWI